MKYFVFRDGSASGPFSKQQVLAAIKSKKLRRTDLLGTSAEGPWQKVEDAVGTKNPKASTAKQPVESEAQNKQGNASAGEVDDSWDSADDFGDLADNFWNVDDDFGDVDDDIGGLPDPPVKAEVETVSADLPSANLASKEPIRVKVVDFDMHFFSMMVFMIKWALATIPAGIVLFLIYALITGGVVKFLGVGN